MAISISEGLSLPCLPVAPGLALPIELIEQIVDHVSNQADPIPTLKQCSLVSRSFHCASRRHFLSKITFAVDICTKKSTRHFLSTFGQRSEANNFDSVQIIRGLTIVGIRESPRTMLNGYSENVDIWKTVGRVSNAPLRSIPWKRWHKLAPVFDVLSYAPLETFALKHLLGSSISNNATTIQKIMSIPSLGTLSFEDQRNFPADLMWSAMYSTSIQRLKVINVDLAISTDSGYYLNLVRGSQSTIEELELRLWTYAPFLRILHHFRFPCLKALAIQVPATEEDSNTLWKYLMRYIPSGLEHLHFYNSNNGFTIFVPTNSTGRFDPFYLDNLTALRDIQYDLHASSAVDLAAKYVELARFFATATIRNNIESITLRILAYQLQVFVPDSTTGWLGWHLIDETLVGRTFARLARVDVQVYPNPSLLLELEAALPLTIDSKALFPLLSGHPSIRLSMTVEM